MKTCIVCGKPLKKLIIDPDHPGTATWVEIQGPYCDRHGWYDFVYFMMGLE